MATSLLLLQGAVVGSSWRTYEYAEYRGEHDARLRGAKDAEPMMVLAPPMPSSPPPMTAPVQRGRVRSSKPSRQGAVRTPGRTRAASAEHGRSGRRRGLSHETPPSRGGRHRASSAEPAPRRQRGSGSGTGVSSAGHAPTARRRLVVETGATKTAAAADELPSPLEYMRLRSMGAFPASMPAPRLSSRPGSAPPGHSAAQAHAMRLRGRYAGASARRLSVDAAPGGGIGLRWRIPEPTVPGVARRMRARARERERRRPSVLVSAHGAPLVADAGGVHAWKAQSKHARGEVSHLGFARARRPSLDDMRTRTYFPSVDGTGRAPFNPTPDAAAPHCYDLPPLDRVTPEVGFGCERDRFGGRERFGLHGSRHISWGHVREECGHREATPGPGAYRRPRAEALSEHRRGSAAAFPADERWHYQQPFLPFNDKELTRVGGEPGANRYDPGRGQRFLDRAKPSATFGAAPRATDYWASLAGGEHGADYALSMAGGNGGERGAGTGALGWDGAPDAAVRNLLARIQRNRAKRTASAAGALPQGAGFGSGVLRGGSVGYGAPGSWSVVAPRRRHGSVPSRRR